MFICLVVDVPGANIGNKGGVAGQHSPAGCLMWRTSRLLPTCQTQSQYQSRPVVPTANRNALWLSYPLIKTACNFDTALL